MATRPKPYYQQPAIRTLPDFSSGLVGAYSVVLEPGPPVVAFRAYSVPTCVPMGLERDRDEAFETRHYRRGSPSDGESENHKGKRLVTRAIPEHLANDRVRRDAVLVREYLLMKRAQTKRLPARVAVGLQVDLYRWLPWNGPARGTHAAFLAEVAKVLVGLVLERPNQIVESRGRFLHCASELDEKIVLVLYRPTLPP